VFGFAGRVCAQTISVSSPAELSQDADYRKYTDPLLHVKDFGTRYVEDGAADMTVVSPEGMEPPYGPRKPAGPVLALIALKSKALPMLIDCLGDARITSMRFEGSRTTQALSVPIGYLCLDILMNVVTGKPVWIPNCEADGLGACMETDFYFRPDDYYACAGEECRPRPWVLVVKRNWKRAFLAHQIRFQDPHPAP